MADHDLPLLCCLFLPRQEPAGCLPEFADTQVCGKDLPCYRIYQHTQVLHLLLGFEIGLLVVYHDPQIATKL